MIAGSLYNESCKNLPAIALPPVQARQRQLQTTVNSMQSENQRLHTRYVINTLKAIKFVWEKELMVFPVT